MPQSKTVVLTREFPAPPQRVFDAWTRAEHLGHWFGPRGFTVPECETDPRQGGLFRLCMRSPDGRDYWVRGSFRELSAPRRVVIVCTAEDQDGVVRLEETIEVTLEPHGGGTRLTLNAQARGTGPEAESMLAGMQQGWSQTIDRLNVLLEPKTDKET